MENETNYLIKIQDITREFEQPANGILKVLNGVSLTVSPGNTLALMGPNGCGKTTLLRIISGELAPTSGKIYFLDREVTNVPDYKRARILGRVHQESYKSLGSDLTVEETLVLATRRNTKLSLHFPNSRYILEDIRKFSEKAAIFIETRKRLATRLLSGGQRQLLAIIAATLGQSRVLILDEHLASLDEEYKSVANELTDGFVASSGGAFIAVTHDRQWAENYAKNIMHFSHGTFDGGKK